MTKEKPILPIPDKDNLYRRFAPNQCKDDGKPISGAFSEPDMSTDWAAHVSGPELTIKKYPGYGVVSLNAGDMRHKCQQEVQHTPSKSNYAHATVRGNKNSKIVRKQIRELSTVVIPAVSPPAAH